MLSETLLATQIGAALQTDLGASRRATKMIMRWTGVSDTTARAWLHGKASPSGLHLIALAAHSNPVMIAVLRLAGYGELELGVQLLEIEAALTKALEQVRGITSSQPNPTV
jgi:hypothetical protein